MYLENLNFLHYYQPQPIIYKLGLISFYWYGLFVILGALAGIFAWHYYAKKTGSFVGRNYFFDIIIGCAFWGLIGARVYHIFCELPYYWQYPLEILLIWHGGLSIFGALIAGAIFIVFYARKKHLNLLALLDGYALAVLIGEAIGRWGNYFNQEIFGLPTDRWWGIYISPENRPDIFSSFSYFHPTFLYQFIYSLIIFSAILVFLNIIKKITPGVILSFYLIFYSIGRFLFEFLRIDHQPIIGFLRLSQWLCILMFGTGMFLFSQIYPVKNSIKTILFGRH
ncbi:MAG: prolipoprotein diacylglyceryl transferase [Patescibacteria group bacterium]